MSIKETLLKAKKNVRTRVDNALGRGSDLDPLAIRQGILCQIESKIVEDIGGKIFPFGRIVVRLQPHTKAQSAAIDDALLQTGTLKSDIVQMLKEAQARFPDELETSIELRPHSAPNPEDSSDRPAFEMDFIKSESLKSQPIPEAKLLIIKGITEKAEYIMRKFHILVGRSPEVLDREGRMVRRNDVVFMESDEEINRSVGRTHARIWFDLEKNEFFILDEGSRYGTRILRDGSAIEVPSGEPAGIRLQSGDDIYCGQACLRFTLPAETGSISSI
jgi:hypothetical protein